MSSKPILYYAIRSPPSRSILMTAAAIGLELDKRVGDFKDPNLAKINPIKTVPVLIDNGTIINDSHVINTYLVDTYAKDDKLYPKDPEKRRIVDALLFFDACHLFARSRMMVDPIFFKGATQIEKSSIEYMQHAYDLLENRIGDSPYVAGDNLTIADFHILTTIITSIGIAPLIEEKHSNIKSWLERMSQLPYHDEINKPGLESLQLFVKQTIEANMKAKNIK